MLAEIMDNVAGARVAMTVAEIESGFHTASKAVNHLAAAVFTFWFGAIFGHFGVSLFDAGR
jgi:hypothetical protein